jgi:phospholipase C
LGVRVPGILVSPYADSGAVCHELFDHTSVLQLLAELFTPGRPYSADVEQRRQHGIRSLSVALSDRPRADVPKVPADPVEVKSALGAAVRIRPASGLQASFELATTNLIGSHRDAFAKKYPDLIHWKAAVDAERGQPTP